VRHTYASHLIIDLGRDFAEVSRMLGHARITITLDTYTHLFEDARHAQDIRTRMAASPFAGLLEPTAAAPGATVLKLRCLFSLVVGPGSVDGSAGAREARNGSVCLPERARRQRRRSAYVRALQEPWSTCLGAPP
jgi:hypothetical protein